MGLFSRLIGAAKERIKKLPIRDYKAAQLAIQRVASPAPSPAAYEQTRKLYGDRGRLEIPDLDISVPLYDTYGKDSQKIVDTYNSAAYLHWGEQVAIADHASQANFIRLNQVREGITDAYIVNQGAREKYVCYQSQVGHIQTVNGKNQIYDAKWRSVFTQNTSGLTIYTCMQRSAPDVMDIRLTYWKKTNIE